MAQGSEGRSPARQGKPGWWERYDDLQALHPGLPQLEGPPRDEEAWGHLVGTLLDALERSHRLVIQRDTQLAGLRDLADRLLSADDPRTVARLLTQYLQRSYGFSRVLLVLRDADASGYRAFWASGETPLPTQGEVLWSEEEIRGTYLEQILRGDAERPEAPEPQRGAGQGLPHPADLHPDRFNLICPLETGQGREGSVLGVLAVRLAPGTEGSSAARWEVEGIAHALAAAVERHRLQREILRAHRLREDLLRSLGHALLAADLQGRVLVVNEAAAEWTGYPARTLVGRRLEELPANFRPLVQRLEIALHQSRDLPPWEARLASRDGRERPISITTNLLRDAHGHPYGAVAVAADLQAVKEMEQKIRQLDRLAVLGRFTAAIAHEIKNPLAGISAGVEFLRRAFPPEAPEQKDVQFLQEEVQRLNRFIQDLFDLANPHALNLAPTRLQEVVRGAVETVRPILEERGVEVVIREGEIPEVVADGERLRQVFVNLLKNAAEASRPGQRVEVQLERCGEGRVRATVRDEGSGMTPEQLERLFEPFFTTKESGTGLGLYVCHGIVQRHGGNLEVESRPGEGSTFRLTLPVAGPPAEEEAS
jgi:PAS domain S-box-containing protein